MLRKPLHPLAAFALYGGLCLIVLAFLVISGVANVSIWWDSAQGWNRYVFTALGIGAEGWGALGLLLLTRRYGQGQYLKALIAFALWLPAVAFNGYSTYRYFNASGSAVVATVETQAAILDLSETRIPELTAEIEAIGFTRTPAEITAERDGLPENYRTRRAALDAELSKAQRRADLVTELATVRATKIETTGANANETKALTDWRILVALVIWMEAVKALGLWVIFGRSQTASEARTEALQENEPEAQTHEETPQGVNLGAGEREIFTPEGERRVVRVL